jgi:hypothetical protein
MRRAKGLIAMLKIRPELSISPEKVCFIIVKAHEFDVQDLAIEEDEVANCEAMRPVLEDAHDPRRIQVVYEPPTGDAAKHAVSGE